MLPESRIVADLLLQGVDTAGWKQADPGRGQQGPADECFHGGHAGSELGNRGVGFVDDQQKILGEIIEQAGGPLSRLPLSDGAFRAD